MIITERYPLQIKLSLLAEFLMAYETNPSWHGFVFLYVIK
jgi:hypothetical protein